MKNFNTFYFVLAALLISSFSIAQPAVQDSATIEYISNRTVDLMDNPNDYTGSPYYSEDFQKGNIQVDGKIIALNQDLRYNVSKEEFEIKDQANKNSKIVNTINRSKKIEIIINKDHFEYISSSKNGLRGYFIPMFKGEKNALYKKVKKKYITSQKAVNSMSSDVPAMYIEKELFYIVDKEDVFTEMPSSKRAKIKAFGDQTKVVKAYVKQNKLNLNKENDLLQVVSYLDTL